MQGDGAVTQAVPAKKAPAGAYRYYVLFLLTAVYTFNFIDRQIIGIISPAIKDDLGLADWRLGILKGFAFAVLYTTLGIPIARLADRTNRVNIISLALAAWSAFTALSGVAQNFAQLALARVGVGVGEAGGSPPAHSLISDYFPMEKRAGALAIYALGIPIGITLAYLGGGWLAYNVNWRAAFIAVGLPGVLLAIVLKLTVREPERGASDAPGREDAFKAMRATAPEGATERVIHFTTRALPESWANPAFRELAILWRAAKHLLSIPTYRGVVAGMTLASFAAYANGAWIVDYFARSHPDFSRVEVTFWLGIINGTAYAAGTFLGGQIVDRLAAKNKAMYGIVPAVSLLVNAPFFVAAVWANDPVLSLILWTPVHLTVGFYLGPCFALAQTLAPVSIRALSTAIFFFILNMIALGFGPTYVGFASSLLVPTMGDALALQVSMTSVTLAVLGAMAAFLWTSRQVERDWAKAAAHD
ncbi:MAG: spinster family MFS transporter [Parvularculaceae bacterium]